MKPIGAYSPRERAMLRSVSLLSAAAAMSLVGVGAAGVTNAVPSDEANSGTCSWVLTPPRVVKVSSTSMVLATVNPGPCTMDAIPNDSVVCLSIKGEDSQGECAHRAGSSPASIYYPYRPGATYVVTGQGCADVVEDPVNHTTTGPVTKLCQAIGPTAFTL